MLKIDSVQSFNDEGPEAKRPQKYKKYEKLWEKNIFLTNTNININKRLCWDLYLRSMIKKVQCSFFWLSEFSFKTCELCNFGEVRSIARSNKCAHFMANFNENNTPELNYLWNSIKCQHTITTSQSFQVTYQCKAAFEIGYVLFHLSLSFTYTVAISFSACNHFHYLYLQPKNNKWKKGRAEKKWQILYSM